MMVIGEGRMVWKSKAAQEGRVSEERNNNGEGLSDVRRKVG